MSALGFLIVLAALSGVVLFVTAPLRRPAGPSSSLDEERGELEAARDAKYREIRDAELDHRTGKLSDEDYEAVDGRLRTEAIEILEALDRVDAAPATIPGT